MARREEDEELAAVAADALRRQVVGGLAQRKPTQMAVHSTSPVAHALAAVGTAVHGAIAHAVAAHAAPVHAAHPPTHAATTHPPAHAATTHPPAHAATTHPLAHRATSHSLVHAATTHPPAPSSPARAVAHVVGLGAHAVAHAAERAVVIARQAATAVGSLAHQVGQHANRLIPPVHAAPAGAPNFADGRVYRVSADGRAAPVQSVPADAPVYVNGLHPFHNGTGDAIRGAQAVSHNNGNRDVYVVYNGHSLPTSVFTSRNPAHPDAATQRVAQIMQQNRGNNTFYGYSQGGAQIVSAAQRYSAAGGTDGKHGLGGVKIDTWGSTATPASVGNIAQHGAAVTDYVHPIVEQRVAGIGVPTRLGDFWAQLAGGGHVTVVDGKTTASDAHTVAVPDRGDNVFHVYDGADPQLGARGGK